MSSDSAVNSRSQNQQQAQVDERPRAQRGLSSYFPLGYKEAACQWWTSVTPTAAERNVLSFVPFLKEATAAAAATSEGPAQNGSAAAKNSDDPFGSRIWRSTMVALSGKNRALNEFSVERENEQVEDTLVVLHGYGAGLGFFYKNFEPLTRLPGWRLYALDMLGMGNSSRPPFRVRARDPQERIAEAEGWFVDALEEWRRIRRIDRFTLLAHSLGGYLAVSYALKYPGHLDKLILASPVGIPEDPYAVSAAMPEPDESTLESEFTQEQESIVSRPSSVNGSVNGASNNHNKKDSPAPAPRRPLPGWLVWLWDANVSPFSLVRLSGPLGPRFVSGWTSRRFNHLPPGEAQALHAYAYGLFRQRGSGEYALPYILAPGAYARSPVIHRIQDVGRQPLPAPESETEGAASAATPAAPRRETGIPVVLMYGESDWMDVAGGFAAAEKLKRRAAEALLEDGTDPDQRRNENGSARVVIVPRAGHHLYLDNPDHFNEVMLDEMRDTRARKAARTSSR